MTKREIPVLTKRDGLTQADAIVSTNYLPGPMRFCHSISEVCSEYPGRVFVERNDEKHERVTCKRITDLTCHIFERGESIKISVEGDDRAAEGLVYWLYDKFTSPEKVTWSPLDEWR